jgi:DNA polymerase III delta prime subunit
MEKIFDINCLDDIVGNNSTIKELEKQFNELKLNDRYMIIGPSGVGKTKTIELLATKYDYECIKIDSTNCENSKILQDRLIKLHQWKDIFTFQENKKKRVLLIDELETLIKMDRNIPSTIVKFWNTYSNCIPCIIIGQHEAEKKTGELKKLCKIYYFETLSSKEIQKYLRERVSIKLIKQSDLKNICEMSNGSIYAAIQSILEMNSKKYKPTLLYSQDSIFTIDNIFKTLNNKEIYMVLQEDPWIHPLKVIENANKVYSFNEYTTFLKNYLFFEEWMYRGGSGNNDTLPIGFLTELIKQYNQRISIKKYKNISITIEFTKLLSYISTQKKLHRSLYEKLPHHLPISEIGYYWAHQLKTIK